MTKIIYYCDLHKGGFKPATDETDVTLRGELALDLQRAILGYAHSNNVDEVIHGGDESTFVKDSPAHHLNRARFIAGAMTYRMGNLHRVIGNHEPIKHLKALGFKTKSYAKNLPDNRNKIIIAQPDIETPEGRTLYSYDGTPLVKEVPRMARERKNLIFASHWALDRIERGYPELYDIKGYGYLDKTERLKDKFAQYAQDDVNRIVTLHGHEHRFSMTTNLGFNCLVMPAITQVDIDDPEQACGLFVEITDDNDRNQLRLTFKKITLNKDEPEESVIEDVDMAYMNQYHRPVARRLFQ